MKKLKWKFGSSVVKVKIKKQKEEKTSIVPSTQAFIELIQEQVKNGKDINLIQNPTNVFQRVGTVIFSFLPTMTILIMLILIFKMQGLGDKGKIYDADKSKEKTTFDDVAGLDEEKSELIEIVKFLKEPKKFHEMGAKTPRGILLCGKPRHSVKH